MMTGSTLTLRPEAGFIPLASLTECQTNALHNIVASMETAIASLTPSREQKSAIDPTRVSRIFFVSGEPGSGKSSLFMTLREIMGNTDLPLHARDKHRVSENDRKQYVQQCPALRRLDGATRWLEQIDLEVAGDEGENLLAAVLVRIIAVLDNKWSAAAPKVCQQALDDLNRLGHDIGIAWDGNLKERASRLDPESYSMEVMNAQRARLRTNQRLHEALDTLARENCCGCKENTLFVLPIDDFYLKPAVTLELLRLLRMISVPRLFFLVMGDLKTMESLFQEKALADWTAVAGPGVFGSLGVQKQQEVLSRAREMSRRYLRKLLPVGQRAMMNQMKLREALNFRPSSDNTYDDRKLWNLLDNVQICWTRGSTNRKTLCNFLIPQTLRENLLEEDENNKQDKDFSTNSLGSKAYYSALGILEAMPREVLDLWIFFDELKNEHNVDENSIPAYLDNILNMIPRNLEEQDFLTHHRQEALLSAFPTGYDAGVVRTDMLDIRANVAGREASSSTALFLRQHFGWVINVTDDTTNDVTYATRNGGDNSKGCAPSNAFSHLPPRQSAWIILLHDLSVHWKQEQSITTNLVDKLFNALKTEICYEPSHDHPGWAWYKDPVMTKKSQPPHSAKHSPIGNESEESKVAQTPGESKTTMDDGAAEKQAVKWIHFPFPKLDTFRQLDCLLEIWNQGLRNSCSQSSQSLNRTTPLNLWLRACWIATGPEDRYNSKMLLTEAGGFQPECKGTSDEESFAEFNQCFSKKYSVFYKLYEKELPDNQ